MSEDNNLLKTLFIKINYTIYSFEKSIEITDSNIQKLPSQDKYKGYIIKLKDYQDLKEKINYNKVKSLCSSQNSNQIQQMLQNFDMNKMKAVNNIKPIEYNTPRYLIYKITNKESYIIINEELFNLIRNINKENKDNNSFVEYKMEKDNQISINFGNDENIYLWTNNNTIINEFSFNYSIKREEYKCFTQEYKNIIKDINSYYNIEKQFIENSKKENNSEPKSGYLISNSWLVNWKKITNYEKIKVLMELNGNNNNISTEISNEIMNHLEKNKFKYSDLPPLEILCFKTKKELDNFLTNDSLVIIDNDFKGNFKLKSQESLTIYNLNKNQIVLNTNNDMTFNIYKNRILSKEKLNIFYLKQLFKMIKCNPGIETNNNNNIYLISRKILNDFKYIFDYDRISSILINKNISYNNNLGQYFSEIMKIIAIEEQFMDKLKKINFLDELNKIKNNYIFINYY